MHHFRNYIIQVRFQVFGSEIVDDCLIFCESNSLKNLSYAKRVNPACDCKTIPSKNSYFFLRDPAKALYQRKPKPRVMMDEKDG